MVLIFVTKKVIYKWVELVYRFSTFKDKVRYFLCSTTFIVKPEKEGETLHSTCTHSTSSLYFDIFACTTHNVCDHLFIHFHMKNYFQFKFLFIIMFMSRVKS